MQDIIDAIRDILHTQYPNVPVLCTNQPEGFDRPSFFVEFIQETRHDENYWTTAGEMPIQITYFAPTDEYYNADTANQYSVYETVMGLFPRSIPVGDRYYYLNQITGNKRDHEIFFTLTLTRYTNRPIPTPDAPATELNLNLQGG